QDKNTPALVVVEDLLKSSNASGAAHVLHAKLLLRAGEIERAVREYKTGVDNDPDAADLELAGRLGIGADADDDVSDGRVRSTFGDEDERDREVSVERPKIDFKDVGGMDKVKDEIRMKIIHPLTHPELYKAYGKAIGGGILMYGPPGCGKTHLARATAGEIHAGFIAV